MGAHTTKDKKIIRCSLDKKSLDEVMVNVGGVSHELQVSNKYFAK